ncbi:hypothetical protein TNCV_1538791 [Trichonephila clavipes]|nr:hypothetical protein TNCV_1538791 [Trichonephila clavipes]
MVSYNSKVFPEYVRPKFVGSPYDGKTFPFCGGIILFGFVRVLEAYAITSRHYSEFVPDSSDTVPACISMDFCRSSFVVHPQYWIRSALHRPNGMTLNSYKPSGVINAVFFMIRFVYFYLPITRSEIHGRKEHGTFQTVERIVNTRQRINVFFRDAIQLAIIDAKTPTTVFFLRAQWVMTKDFQRVGRYLHQAFSEPLHE